MIQAIILAASLAFVWLTSRGLPDHVASHFGPGGTADGFMSRGGYLAFMLVMVLLVPGLLQLVSRLTSRIPDRYHNIPNRDYWLAPERRDGTLASMTRFIDLVSWLSLGLLLVIHLMVVRANTVQPASLPTMLLMIIMAIYIILLATAMYLTMGRFFRKP